MAACGGPERCKHRPDFFGIEISENKLPIGFDSVDMTGELKMGKQPSVAQPDVFDGVTYVFQKKEDGKLFAIPKNKPGVAAKAFVLPFECKDTMELYTKELVGKEVSLMEDKREGMYPVKIYDAGTKENLLLKVMLRMASTLMLKPPSLPLVIIPQLSIPFDPVDLTGDLKMGKEPSVAQPDVFDSAIYVFQKNETGKLFAIPKNKPGVAAKEFVLPFEYKDTMELYTKELVGKEVFLMEDTREGMYTLKIYDAETKEDLLLKVMLRMASTHMLVPPRFPQLILPQIPLMHVKFARISAVNYRDVYVQFKPEYADMMLYTLDLSVEQALKSGRSLYPVCEPDMETMYVLHHKTKGQFYRAKAIQVDGLKAVVRLVDYGSMLKVPKCHLYKLSDICPELQKVPEQAIGTNILKLNGCKHVFEYQIEMIMKSKKLVELSLRVPDFQGRLPVVDINMSEIQCSATLPLMSAYTNTCYMVDTEVENCLKKYRTRIEQVMLDFNV